MYFLFYQPKQFNYFVEYGIGYLSESRLHQRTKTDPVPPAKKLEKPTHNYLDLLGEKGGLGASNAQELEAQGTGIKFISSQPAGGTLLLKGLWERIGIDRCLSEALKDREFTTPVEDAIFAMVANRALAPASKLAVEEWAAKDVYLDIERPIQVQHLYRSMDFFA